MPRLWKFRFRFLCFLFIPALDRMATMKIMTDEQQKGFIAELSEELAALLDDRDVPTWLQARIAFAGCKKLGTFGRIDSTDTAVREWIIDTLEVDPKADPLNRSAIATVIDAWQASKKRLDRRDDVEAEERATKVQKTIPKKDYVRMKMAYAKAHNSNKSLQDYETPFHEGFETTCEQLEDSEILAEDLREVASEKEIQKDPDDAMTPVYQRDGTTKWKIKKNQVPPPKDAEAFRYRMRLLSVKWVMLKDKYPNNALLQTITTSTFNAFADFILGPEIVGLDAKDASGASIVKPAWQIILSYELEVRRKAFRAFNEERTPLAQALTDAMKDSWLKQRFLQIPIFISAAAVATTQLPSVPPGKGQRTKNAGQRKQTNPPQNQNGMVSRTQANKQRKFADETGNEICFNFQKDACITPHCPSSHICSYCLGDHSFNTCPWILPAQSNGTTPPAANQWSGKGQKQGWKGKAKGKGGKGQGRGWKGQGQWQQAQWGTGANNTGI